MDALEAIHTRRSIRKYRDEPVPDELIDKVLAAAMSAPSARNQQPWQFLVVRDKSLLGQIPRICPNAAMIARAPLAILICADLDLETSPGYWVVDCAAATQNLLLAAHALGLGAVWCGVYPRQDRMTGLHQLFALPTRVVAHSLAAIGYPAEQPAPQNRYRSDRVHQDGW